jgi:UDP-glucose 4-epimerase
MNYYIHKSRLDYITRGIDMTHHVVIGGAGFVGSWVVEEILKDETSQVTIIDNLISSERWNVSTNPRVTLIESSAADFATFEKVQKPIDFVYQLACFHGNQSSIARPLDDLENGLKTTLVTLEWMKNNSPHSRIIYSGAGCAVAAKTWESPEPAEEIDYTSLLHDSPYSISKITGEMYCLYYSNLFNLDVVRVRFQNVYGPREILGAGIWRGTENTIWRNVIPTFIYKALNDLPIEQYGSERASRDFTYVADVAKSVVAVGKKGLQSQVYNIASGREIFIDELLDLILAMTGSNSVVTRQNKRGWDNSGRRLGNNQKLTNEIGVSLEVGIHEGLKRTLEWTELNLGKIKKSIAKHENLPR